MLRTIDNKQRSTIYIEFINIQLITKTFLSIREREVLSIT